LLLLSEVISLSASDFIATNPQQLIRLGDRTSLILSAFLHELKLFTARNNTWTRMPTKKLIACSYFLVGNQRDSVGIRLGPSCELLAGSYFLVTAAPFCVVAANVRTEAGRSKGMK